MPESNIRSPYDGHRPLFRYDMDFPWGSLMVTHGAAADYNLMPLAIRPEKDPQYDSSSFAMPFVANVVIDGSEAARNLEIDKAAGNGAYGTRSQLRYWPGEALINVGFEQTLPELHNTFLKVHSKEVGIPIEELAASTDNDQGVPLGESLYHALPEQLSKAVARVVSRRMLEACVLHADNEANKSFRRYVRNIGVVAGAAAGLLFGTSETVREAAPVAYGYTGLISSTVSAYAYRAAKRRHAAAVSPVPPQKWQVAACAAGQDVEHTFSRSDFAAHFWPLMRSEPSL